MLILARESRRMTQKALAEASETTQASVSRAEAGVHEPLPETVAAWAKALRYPESFFAHHNDAPPLPRTFWRKQAKLGKTDQKEIEARIGILCMNIQALARSVDVPEADAPGIQLGVDAKTPAEAARYMRAQWRVPAGPIDDLVHLVESNGIMVVMLPGSQGFQGVSIRDVRKDLPPVIFVSAEDPADRQRWTIAHELGHIVLHHHLQTLAAESEDEIEYEADDFAGELLMPAHEIRHQFAYKTGLAELAQLKLHWRTSMAALIRRGVRLDRISDSQATRLWKLMSKFGYRRSEPNEFSPEEPTMLRELVRVHVDELGFTEDELATLLALDLEDVRSRFLDVIPTEPDPAPQQTKPKLRLVP
jgi:Zn-dependent peptidase ImmA (M78 family)